MTTQEFDASKYEHADADKIIIGVCFIKATGKSQLTVTTSARGNDFLRGNIFHAQGLIEEGVDQSETFKGLPVNLLQSDRGLSKSSWDAMMKKINAFFSKNPNYPFIGVVMEMDNLAEIVGTDGKVTAFPNNPRIIEICKVVPYQSAKQRKALRMQTVNTLPARPIKAPVKKSR